MPAVAGGAVRAWPGATDHGTSDWWLLPWLLRVHAAAAAGWRPSATLVWCSCTAVAGGILYTWAQSRCAWLAHYGATIPHAVLSGPLGPYCTRDRSPRDTHTMMPRAGCDLPGSYWGRAPAISDIVQRSCMSRPANVRRPNDEGRVRAACARVHAYSSIPYDTKFIQPYARVVTIRVATI